MNEDIVESLVPKLVQAFRQVRPNLLDDWKKGSIEKDYKDGGSVVTSWDMKLDGLITKHLHPLGLAIFSEESLPETLTHFPEQYWLVDPLDGTIEFVEGTEDFAINIALVRNGYSIWGLIYHPVSDRCYYTCQDKVICLMPDNTKDILPELTPRCRHMRLVLSKRQYVHWQKKNIPVDSDSIRLVGASLKYIEIGLDKADIYPRGGVCGAWDTAAGQIIIETLGGVVLEISSQKRLSYSKNQLINPGFIVAASKDQALGFIEKYHRYF